jgi:hypothetical protein
MIWIFGCDFTGSTDVTPVDSKLPRRVGSIDVDLSAVCACFTSFTGGMMTGDGEEARRSKIQEWTISTIGLIGNNTLCPIGAIPHIADRVSLLCASRSKLYFQMAKTSARHWTDAISYWPHKPLNATVTSDIFLYSLSISYFPHSPISSTVWWQKCKTSQNAVI